MVSRDEHAMDMSSVLDIKIICCRYSYPHLCGIWFSVHTKICIFKHWMKIVFISIQVWPVFNMVIKGCLLCKELKLTKIFVSNSVIWVDQAFDQ